MTAFIAWGEAALWGSTALLLLVLAVRVPVRRWVGPRLGYALWALPAVRMILPALPADWFAAPLAGLAAPEMSVLFAGPEGVSMSRGEPNLSSLAETFFAIWLAGAVGLFAVYAMRHFAFCRRLRADGTGFGCVGDIRIVAADVEGPLAFGVFRRCIAVPRAFERDYQADERDLALAHERAHHARGDLIANWVSLVVLAAHWWNPVAWIAIRAFRDDQEFAADADVLARRQPGTRAVYASVLAKAAGIGALPACNLNARSNLKGRLMMLAQKPRSGRRLVLGGAALAILGCVALGATVPTAAAPGSVPGKQAVTIGIKPDGSGSYALIIGGAAVARDAKLSGGVTLPADLSEAGGCDLKPTAKPFAMVIKGMNGTQTYTVMCASAAPAPIRATLAEGLASLNTMRASVATQQTPSFPETERRHALGAIDRSIHEVEATLAAGG